MSLPLRIYHNMPPFSRSMAASLRGYYLRSWRYDSSTDERVEKALVRDYWTKQDWEKWHRERLSLVLERAATKVPYYKTLWNERRKTGDQSSWTHLENWPILEKTDLRQQSEAFVATDRSRSMMFSDSTSGTTATPLKLWLTSESVKRWYALFEARCRKWYGVSRHDRWAMIGGQLIVPAKKKNPPFWVWNKGLNQLYMSSYHLAPHNVGHYAAALLKYDVRYILGYTSSLYTLATEILRQKIKVLGLKVAITNAEPVLDHQREAIAEAFGCPVRETYGMAEIAAAASECEHGRLHQWPDAGIIETGLVEDRESSDLICTGLINADMPLVRYRVGDAGSLSDKICECGRRLPLIESIYGRNDDLVYLRDGRRIGRLDPVFKGEMRIREAQIVQKGLDRFVIRYVPDDGFRQSDIKLMAERLRERVGNVEIIPQSVDTIGRTARGKFRAVVCELSATERRSVSTG